VLVAWGNEGVQNAAPAWYRRLIPGFDAGEPSAVQASIQTWSSDSLWQAERRIVVRHAEEYSEKIRIEDLGALMRYASVIERAGTNYSGYVLDLPGCIATGHTIAETEEAIRKAIEFHIEGMREDGAPIPPPSSHVNYVEVAA
jgi:predicted RNase H-like HicB family nuclease